MVECCTTVMLSKPNTSLMDLVVGALRPRALKRPADKNDASTRGPETAGGAAAPAALGRAAAGAAGATNGGLGPPLGRLESASAEGTGRGPC
jgi:hypothetical protein